LGLEGAGACRRRIDSLWRHRYQLVVLPVDLPRALLDWQASLHSHETALCDITAGTPVAPADRLTLDGSRSGQTFAIAGRTGFALLSATDPTGTTSP
jgi:hypothetical protein